jgi:putative transposase
MGRQPRCTLPEVGAFHVINRGVDRQAIFRDDQDREFFLGLMGRARTKFEWMLPAYVLMGNHFHFVMLGDLDRLSDGMHYLSFRYAMEFNERHARTGHLFQGRFISIPIEGDDHLDTVCTYVLNNPVRAGLCERFEDYEWFGGDWFDDLR